MWFQGEVTPISEYCINSSCAVLQDSIYYLVLIGSHSNKGYDDDTLELQVLMSSQICPLILHMSGYSAFPIRVSGHKSLGGRTERLSQNILAKATSYVSGFQI